MAAADDSECEDMFRKLVGCNARLTRPHAPSGEMDALSHPSFETNPGVNVAK